MVCALFLSAMLVTNLQAQSATVRVEVRSNQQLIDSAEVKIKDRKSTRLNSSHSDRSRMPSSA